MSSFHEAIETVKPALECCDKRESSPCVACGGFDAVSPDIRERDNALAWVAVCELRADFLVDKPDYDITDDVPYEPTEDDHFWYRSLCREHDGRVWDAQVEAGPPLARQLRDVMAGFKAVGDPFYLGLAGEIARVADLAEFTGAGSWDDLWDRRDAMLAGAAEAAMMRRE